MINVAQSSGEWSLTTILCELNPQQCDFYYFDVTPLIWKASSPPPANGHSQIASFIPSSHHHNVANIFLLYVKACLKRVERNAPLPRQFCHRSTALTLSTAAQCAAQERLRSSRRWKETGVGLPVDPLWTRPVPLCGHTELHTSSFPFCLFQKTTPRFSAGRTASKSAVHTTPSQKGQERKIRQEWKGGGAEKEKQ